MDGKLTQHRIMVLLTQSGGLTSHDLSVECGIDEPAVRYHLRSLKKLGLVVEIPGKHIVPKVGRKASIYCPVNPGGDRNSNLLLKGILTEWLVDRNLPGIALADIYLKETGWQSDPTIPTLKKPLKLRELVEWLNSQNYRAFWEAGKDGPEIGFRNCPYRKCRAGLDVLCEMDMWIIRKLGGMPWCLEERMDYETLTGICRFVVKE